MLSKCDRSTTRNQTTTPMTILHASTRRIVNTAGKVFIHYASCLPLLHMRGSLLRQIHCLSPVIIMYRLPICWEGGEFSNRDATGTRTVKAIFPATYNAVCSVLSYLNDAHQQEDKEESDSESYPLDFRSVVSVTRVFSPQISISFSNQKAADFVCASSCTASSSLLASYAQRSAPKAGVLCITKLSLFLLKPGLS